MGWQSRHLTDLVALGRNTPQTCGAQSKATSGVHRYAILRRVTIHGVDL